MSFCAISDTIPSDPVFAVQTGHVYERRLIEAAIAENGACPVTGTTLAVEDLLPVKSKRAVRPRPVSAASVPGVLEMLQNEWDAAALETSQLKKHLDTVRQELSLSLYQHDAARRVIARLVKERDEARAALTNAEGIASSAAAAASAGAGSGAGAGAGAGASVGTGITDAVLAELVAVNKKVIKSRKKRKKARHDGLATADDIKAFASASYSPHLSTAPGITCLALHPTDSSTVATGGVDKTVRLFDLASATATATLRGHSARVSAVALHPEGNVVVSASRDTTVRVWAPSAGSAGASASATSDFSTAFTLKPHSGPVVGLHLHPAGNYVCSASSDKTWAMSDISVGSVLASITGDKLSSPFVSSLLHPDGLIMLTSCEDGTINLWDIKEGQTNVANLAVHSAPVRAMAFSDNGFTLSTASDDGVVKIWDLRKLEVVADLKSVDGGAASSLAFDYSGRYLAVGSKSDIGVFSTSSWDHVSTLSGHSNAVTGLGFGPSATSLVSVSMDKTIKIWRGP